jgi:hypothetical protein
MNLPDTRSARRCRARQGRSDLREWELARLLTRLRATTLTLRIKHAFPPNPNGARAVRTAPAIPKQNINADPNTAHRRDSGTGFRQRRLGNSVQVSWSCASAADGRPPPSKACTAEKTAQTVLPSAIAILRPSARSHPRIGGGSARRLPSDHTMIPARCETAHTPTVTPGVDVLADHVSPRLSLAPRPTPRCAARVWLDPPHGGRATVKLVLCPREAACFVSAPKQGERHA